MKIGNNIKTFRRFFVALLLLMGQQAVFAVEKDSTAVQKLDCCTDTTVEDHTSPYHKIIKQGGSMAEGLFTVRHVKDDWYFEVPDTLLSRLMLAVTRFTSVPQGFKMLGGEEVNRSCIYFELYNEQTLFMREYVQTAFAKDEHNISLSLKNATIDPVVNRFDVIGRNPQTNALLVNVTKLFLTDNKITSFSSNDRTILGIGALQSDRTFIDTMKVYPINMEIQTLRTYAITNGKMPTVQSGSATLSLNTSIVLLPKVPMQARLFDERVGFFNNKVTHFSDDDAPEHDAIISRYRLEPKDLKAYQAGKLVEPKKQIVYYIDPATPKKWAKYLKQGIEDWNVAFEAAGFKNAIVAKDWPDDPNMSMEDARFSVLRYLPSETENAYGPRIVDPRSGEIIEAHICWYHNVMQLVKKWYMTQCGPLDKRAQTMNFPDDLMGQLIRFVSSHEVGHTLGLRHNMIASQATPVEKLRDKTWVEKYGHTSSIMDYARFNYVAQPEDKISEKGLFPRINDYDKWAIKWGYQYRPEFSDPVKEKKALRKEVTKVLEGNRRLWWSGDEGKGRDPRSQAEDLGENQMKSNEYGMKNLQRVMQNIVKWTEQPEGEYNDLSMIHRAARAQYQRYVNHVQRYLGGRYTNNAPGQTPYENVPRQLQKEAIAWIGKHVAETPLWLYPDEVISKLGIDADEEIRTRQSTMIALLVSPGMIFNLHNAALHDASPYSVDEYLDDIFAIIWRPLDANDERRNDFRRQEERTYLDFVGKILNPDKTDNKDYNIILQRSDVVLYAERHLDKIEAYVKAQTADTKNAQHYRNMLHRIKVIREKYDNVK